MLKHRSPALVLGMILALSVGFFFALRFRSPREGADELPAVIQVEGKAHAETPSAPALVEQAPETSRRAEAGTSRLEILVLDNSSAPVADANILLFRGDEVFGKVSSDANGLAQFSARAGTGEYLLSATGRNFERGSIELSAGRRTIQLVEGAVVTGTVTVDGAPPTVPMELSWHSSDMADVLHDLAEPVRKAWYGGTQKTDMITAFTSADGTFVLRGMSARSVGAIRWSEAYFLEGATPENDDREVSVTLPCTHLELRLIAGFQMRMRVVDANAVPLPGARVELTLWSESKSRSGTTTMASTAGKEGRFVHAFLPDAFDELEARVLTPKRAGPRSYNFVVPAQRRGIWDLGDLATAATREISLVVRDTDARPIEGAAAYTSSQWSSERTDAEGRMKASIEPGDLELSVQALGYQRAVVPIASDATVVNVTLVRACALEFELPSSVGETGSFVIELKATPPLFVGQDTDMRTAARGWMTNTTGGVTTFSATPSKADHWKVSGLMPGVAIQAKLRGGAKELCIVDVPPLEDGEWRKVQLRAEEVAKSLRVRVLSPSREPIARATVSVFVRSGNMTSDRATEADEAGEVVLHDLYGETCTLSAEAKGYARRFVTLRPIPQPAFDIVLDAAHQVEVELIRRDGSLFLEDAQVFVESEVPRFDPAKSLGQGRYQLGGLPAGEVQIGVRGSFGYASRLIDGSVPFARVVVGEATDLNVTISQIGVNMDERRVAVAEVGSTRDLARARPRSSTEGKGAAGIQGLPPGKYEVWLEQPADESQQAWTRTGKPAAVEISAEHPTASVEL
ncbi:MAG TPA: carboxypeptidase-like regulatory domain-containing protein [Planctomycetota bacterium]|nr:carboxypeptidase-like regulatory domain-containing protein [Planctomycetota bacterium]